MRQKLGQFFDSDGGELLLYFYGHGCVNLGRGICATTNAEPDDEGVFMSEITGLAEQSKAREVVLILDCCHAGVALDSATVDSVPIVSTDGRVLLAGCAEHQQGWETSDKNRRRLGAFSACVLDALEGAAANKAGGGQCKFAYRLRQPRI